MVRMKTNKNRGKERHIVGRYLKRFLLFSMFILPSAAFASEETTLTPDGTYVTGDSYTLAPDGSYVGGKTATLAPDGSYVGGDSAELAPDGTYVGTCGDQ